MAISETITEQLMMQMMDGKMQMEFLCNSHMRQCNMIVENKYFIVIVTLEAVNVWYVVQLSHAVCCVGVFHCAENLD